MRAPLEQNGVQLQTPGRHPVPPLRWRLSFRVRQCGWLPVDLEDVDTLHAKCLESVYNLEDKVARGKSTANLEQVSHLWHGKLQERVTLASITSCQTPECVCLHVVHRKCLFRFPKDAEDLWETWRRQPIRTPTQLSLRAFGPKTAGYKTTLSRTQLCPMPTSGQFVACPMGEDHLVGRAGAEKLARLYTQRATPGPADAPDGRTRPLLGERHGTSSAHAQAHAIEGRGGSRTHARHIRNEGAGGHAPPPRSSSGVVGWSASSGENGLGDW